MSLARKRARLITVDGVTYRWTLRRRPTYNHGMNWGSLTYAVECNEPRGSVLVVDTGRAHPGNWVSVESVPVLPGEVAEGIRRAIALGWEPTREGKPFPLSNGR